MRHYFLGVDVAGEANTWVAAVVPSHGGLSLSFEPTRLGTTNLLELIDEERPTAIAIEGQLSLAFSEGNGFRSCDRELRALLPPDCQAWVASANSLMAVPVRARLLADAVSADVATIVETHPRAAMLLVLGPEHLADLREYKRSDDAVGRLAREWCHRNAIQGVPALSSDGALDALVCATVASCYHLAPQRLRLLRHMAVDRRGRGPFVVMDAIADDTAVQVSQAAEVARPASGPGEASHSSRRSIERDRPMVCPACRQKQFKRWPWGWDAHAAHGCSGLAATAPEDRKAEFKRRFAQYF